MKRLNDLKKQLPSNAKLNSFEFTRVKGGADKNQRGGSGGSSSFGTGTGGGNRPSDNTDAEDGLG